MSEEKSDQQQYADILVERHPDGVAVVTINRPERLNAFSRVTRSELKRALQVLDEEEAVGAIVLTGAGERAFAAGQDLAEAQHFDAERAGQWIDEWGELYAAMLSLAKPCIAAVNGYAVGAGFQVALMCDLRIAAERARLGMPEVDDAIPCITGTWSLYNLIGHARTAELILLGRMLNAHEALTWGLVTRVVPNSELRADTLETARQLTAKPKTAVCLNKQWLRTLLMREFDATVAFAKQAHAEAFHSGAPREAMAAFLAKRQAGRSR
jgi:enoyl-CoA hydratase/carnithine racemase